jgi:hypothetical protein
VTARRLNDYRTDCSGFGAWRIQHYGSNGIAICTWGQSGDIPVT